MLESIQDKRKRGEVLRQYLHTTKDTYMVQGMSTEDLLDMVQNWNYQLTQVGEILGYLSFRELYPLAPFLPPVLLGRLWAKTDSPGPIFLACSGLPDETIHMALSTMSDSEFVAFYGGLSEGQKSHIDRVQNQTLLRQGEAGTLKPDAEG
jgi:hypothetical protein